jgi:hypothetical protein
MERIEPFDEELKFSSNGGSPSNKLHRSLHYDELKCTISQAFGDK